MESQCHVSSTGANDSPSKQPGKNEPPPNLPAHKALDSSSGVSIESSSDLSITATLKPRIIFDATKFAPKRRPPSGVSTHSSKNHSLSALGKFKNYNPKKPMNQQKEGIKTAPPENLKSLSEKVASKQEAFNSPTATLSLQTLGQSSSRGGVSLKSCVHHPEDEIIGSDNATSHSEVRNLPMRISSETTALKKISSVTKLEAATTADHGNEETFLENSGLGTSHRPSAKVGDGSLLVAESETHSGWTNQSNRVVAKEKIRASQGKDPALEHLDFSGARMPPPCDWESGRAKFDNSFMNDYIAEWRAGRACTPDPTGFEKSEEWLSGMFQVNDHSLVRVPSHQDSIPTPGATELIESKRVNQTAHGVACSEMSKNESKAMKQRSSGRRNRTSSPNVVHIAPETSPFSPKIQMYLRPAVIEDSEQIAQIYNSHVTRGNITEDQEQISTEDAMRLIEKNKKEKLPFIVAVAGRVPKKHNAQTDKSKKRNDIIQRHEKTIGFALNERYRYGFSGSADGRSRYTTNLQLFVAYEYQGKGVGRNLLDRLIHTLSTAYGYKKTCEFINPDCDKVHECEGSGMWHQIQFIVPVLKQDDPDFRRIRKFLFSHFLIKEICRMNSTGRTNFKNGPAKWMDTVVFQFETSQEGNFDPYS